MARGFEFDQATGTFKDIPDPEPEKEWLKREPYEPTELQRPVPEEPKKPFVPKRKSRPWLISSNNPPPPPQNNGINSASTPLASPTPVNYVDRYQKGKNGRKELKPNIQYTTPAGHTYKTDHLGRIMEAEGTLTKNTRKRSGYDQKVAGREDRLSTDDGGHLFASIFDGSGELDNLVPMDATLNRGDWKAMENGWSRALDEGKTVKAKANPVYTGTSQRPTSFKIIYQVDNNKPIKKTFIN